MTLKGHHARCFKPSASFGPHHENLNEDRLYYQRRRCSPMTLDSDNIRFMRIFAMVLKKSEDLCKFSLDFMPAPIYYVNPYLTLFVIEFSCFVYDSYLPVRLRQFVKCVTSRDVASGVAKYDPQSIWNPRENCESFVDATSLHCTKTVISFISLTFILLLSSMLRFVNWFLIRIYDDDDDRRNLNKQGQH